ncbi:MAG: hypothetical protein ABSF28_09670 [Terracidiphilus sp.]|jgi:hypothetical protein
MFRHIGICHFHSLPLQICFYFLMSIGVAPAVAVKDDTLFA